MNYSTATQQSVPLLQWSRDQCMTAVMPPRPIVSASVGPAPRVDVLLSTATAFHRQPNQAKSDQCTTVSPWSLHTMRAHAKEMTTFVLACWIYIVPVDERSRQPACLLRQHHVNTRQLSMCLTLLPGSHTLQFKYHPPACYGLPTVTLLSARPIQTKQWLHLTLEFIDGTVRLYVNQQFNSQCILDDHHAYPVLHRSSLSLGWSFNGFLHNVILGNHVSQIQSAISPVPQYPASDVLGPPPLRPYPMDSITELLAWVPHCDPLNISSVPLRQRPPVKQKNRIIHCHDSGGSYTAASYAPGASPVDMHASALTANITPQPTSESRPPTMLSYMFTHWHLIDIFLYFSHHCITIPPQQVMHTAHRNGVPVLGLLTTEGTAGIHQNRLLLANEATSQRCADQLVAIALYYGFDGWTVHIAADLPTDPLPADDSYVQRVIRFTAYLRQQMHQAIAHSMVIMVASLSTNNRGEVEWQSELNDSNMELFDVADAFVTDYKWQPEAVARSAAAAIRAGRSPVDVFMGIDVFGRGSWKWGLDTWQAVQHCFDAGLSVCLYAPSYPTDCLCTGIRATREMARRYERKFWLVDDFKELQLTADQWQPVAATDGTSKPWRHEQDASIGCMVSAAPNAKAGELYAQELTVDLTKLSPCPRAPPVPSVTCLMHYKESPPSANDQVRIVITLLDADGQAVDVYDSGLLTCTDQWQSFDVTFHLLWCKAATLVWRVEGSNADDRTGFSGPRVTVPLLLVCTEPQLTIAGVVQKRRLSFTESLPLGHSVHTGIGMKHGVVYVNYDLQSNRSMVGYRRLPVEHYNELTGDDWKFGYVLPFVKELDDVSSVYPTPALQYGCTNYAIMHGKGLWTAPVRLLEFSNEPTVQPLGQIEQLYVYISFRQPTMLKKVKPYIRLSLPLMNNVGPLHPIADDSILEELLPLELPSADNDHVHRMFCKIPGMLVSGRIVSAVDLVIGYAWHKQVAWMDQISMQTIVITTQPLPPSPVSTDCTAFTRCPDRLPRLRSVHWKFDSALTGVERYSAVLDWSDVPAPHKYPLYQVYCNNIKICATRHTSCWVDSYRGSMKLGERQPLYRVEVL